jgi:hypothetical protein
MTLRDKKNSLPGQGGITSCHSNGVWSSARRSTRLVVPPIVNSEWLATSCGISEWILLIAYLAQIILVGTLNQEADLAMNNPTLRAQLLAAGMTIKAAFVIKRIWQWPWTNGKEIKL